MDYQKLNLKNGNTVTEEHFGRIDEIIASIVEYINEIGDYKNGADGLTPHIGENGNWWIGEIDTGVKARGTDGKNGTNGTNGVDGYTPIKGIDYYTEADKKELIATIIASLPNGNEISY